MSIVLFAKIEALKDNPVPSSIVVTKSTSTFPNLFLEETNTFDNSFPESETFSFNLEEISSGSPTTHSELSLPDYKAFYIDNDHFKEKSSGSTTTHVDFSQYDSFIFDLSNDQFPPADRSDFYHEEFADELAQIISQPEYDCFFKESSIELGISQWMCGKYFPTKDKEFMDCPDCDRLSVLSFIKSFTSSASFGIDILILSTNEVDIIKKTENQAKMTKMSMEWKRLCKIKGQSTKNVRVRVNTDESAVQTEPELKEYLLDVILTHSYGPGKPNSINFDDCEDQNGPSIISTAHLCGNCTRTVKTLKAQS
ncbi:hypothetical protein Tco_1006058 [Tanacetum coccineum]|uniref:Uncharacterized protein n=1 Tax=Tanacetum coccineum TaxID=301880 RepID=A0ABQ5FGR7_9ASTR